MPVEVCTEIDVFPVPALEFGEQTVDDRTEFRWCHSELIAHSCIIHRRRRGHESIPHPPPIATPLR